MPSSSRPITGPECLELNDQLEAYADGDLDADARSRIESHSAECPACRAELDLVRSVSLELQRLPVLACPDALVGRLSVATTDDLEAQGDQTATPDNVVRLPSRASWSRPLMQAAAALLVLGTALFSAYWLLGGAAERPLIKNQELAEVSPAELEQARADLEVALAYFGGLAHKAGLALRDDVVVERVIEPTRTALSRVAIPSQEKPTSMNR